MLYRKRDIKINGDSIEEFRLKVERDWLENKIENGITVGMSYSEIMSMDRRRFQTVYRGKLKALELSLNSQVSLNKRLIVKLSEALSDSNKFNEEDDPIILAPETTVEKTARIANIEGMKLEVLERNIVGR